MELTADFPEFQETTHMSVDIVIYLSMWIREFPLSSAPGAFTFYGIA